MVYIKKVELRAFKSFPNRTISVAFSPTFNVITGPNGSGKSNIIDAIRFVLGENSPKELRQSRMSKLIFDKEPVRSAKVTLVIDNSDRKLPIDGDTVYITREVGEDGESAYYVNHKAMLRGEVLKLLEAARMAYDGLNIVPQGTITRLAELNPNERRNLLESLIGLKSFDEKKAVAMEKLREADQRLAVAFARLDERRAQIERLEVERNELLRFELLERKVKEYRASIILHEIQGLENKIEILKEKLGQLEASVIERTKELEEVQKEVGRLENERSAFYSANVDRIMGVLTEINRRIQQVRIGISELDGRRRLLMEERDRIQRNRPQLVQMLDEMKKVYESKMAALKELERKRGEVRIKLEELTRRIKSLEGELERRERNLGRWRNSLANVERRLKKVNEKRVEVERLLAYYREVCEEEARAFEELKARHGEVVKMVEGLKQRIAELKKLYLQDEEELKEVKGKLDRIEDIRSTLMNEMAKANKVALRSIQELVKAEAIQEVHGKMLRDLAEAEKVEELLSTGILKGYLGKLKDLVSPDPRYKEAVRAAILPLAGALVVKDDEVKDRLIELVRKIKGGRVKVISASRKGEKVKVGGPGIIGPLSDYIKCSEELRGMVDFLFGSTVLVSTDAVALDLVNRGLKAVTVDGVIYDSRMVEVGLMPATLPQALSVDKASLKKLRDAVLSLEKALDKKRCALEKLGNKIKELRSISMEKRVKIESEKVQLEILNELVGRYAKLAERLSVRLEKFERKHLILYKRVEKLERNKEKLLKRESVLEGKREKIRQIINKIGIEAIRAELDKLRQESSNLASESMRLDLEASEISKEIFGEISPKLKRMEDALQMGDERLKVIEDELKEIGARLRELEDEERRLGEMRAKEEGRLSSLAPTLQKIEGELQEVKRKERRLMDGIFRLENEKVKVNAELNLAINQLEAKRKELRTLSVDEPPQYHSKVPELLAELEAEISSLHGAINQLAKQSYREAYTAYKFASERRGELERDRNAIVKFIEEVESEKKKTFMAAFEKIDREVRRVFNKLTDGEAWLELENQDDPFAGGVFFMVKFPGKAAREAAAVSGGEKAISALSFLLALQAAYPSPFYIFDEIDQPLDARYAEKLGNLLAEWSNEVQIIAVSLKDIIASKAHNLIGVYATDGVSNVVRYKLERVSG